MRLYARCSIISVPCLLSVLLHATAQENLRLLDRSSTNAVAGSEIIVTATRVEKPAYDTPYYVDTVGGSIIRSEKGARTISEALEEQTGIMVQKTSHGQGSPYIRGLTGYHDVMLLDGIRLNNSVFREGPNQYWNTVDPLTVSRMEIIKGPSSVLYGSDAVGGTVNVIGKERTEYPAGVNWDRSLYYRYSSAEHANVGRAEISGNVGEKAGVLFGYSYKDFGDLQGGRDVGLQPKTGYDERDWDLKINIYPDDGSEIVVGHQSVDQDDAWRTHKTIYGISWEGTTVGNEKRRSFDQNRELTYLQYHDYNVDSFFDEMHASVSWHNQSEEQYRIKSDDTGDRQGFDVDTLGYLLQLKSPSSVGDFVYGLEYYQDYVDSYLKKYNARGVFTKSDIQGPVADAADYSSLGVFLQDEVALSDKLNIILGGRYEYSSADADAVKDPVSGNKMSVSGDWDAFVGSARAMYDLDSAKTCKLFAGVSQGFRAPNLSDLTRFDTARSNEIETPAPDLDSERFVSYELGVKAKCGAVSGQAACFYNDINGMIVRTPTGRVIEGNNEVTKKNGGNGYIEGVELEICYDVVSTVSLFGNVTWLDGKVETYPTSDPILVEEPVDRLMPLTGNVGVHWTLPRKCWIEVSSELAAKADKLTTRDKEDTQRIPPGGTPGYAVYNLRGGWQASEKLTLMASIENLADEDYRIHGSGLNEPGRNVILAGECRF